MPSNNIGEQESELDFPYGLLEMSKQKFDDQIAGLAEIPFEPENFDEILRRAEIDSAKDLVKPPVILKFDDSDVFSIGDFSCIIGKAKSKKTFLVTLLVASFMNGSASNITTIKKEGKKRIFWFDTEQSKYHVAKAEKRVRSLSNSVSDYELKVISLRQYTPLQRRILINHALIVRNPQKDIALAIIDGIRDLISDINNPDQATDITSWLMKVTSESDLHICTVLHQNKDNTNARGHLGTEIVNKGQTIISVNIKDRISIVEAEQCRDKEFNAFAFAIDENDLPYVIEDYCSEVVEKRKKIVPIDVPIETHRDIFNKIFSTQSEYSRADLVINIKLRYQERNIPFGDSKANEFLQHALNIKVIRHNGANTKNARYLLNQ